MAVVRDRPGLLSRLFHRGPTGAAESAADAVRVARPTNPATATETIDTFSRVAAEVPAIRTVVARSEGDRVDFIVSADGIWHEVIDALEPKLHALVIERGARLDYQVVRPGMDADPVGYYPIFDRGE